tara:strand:+ start:1395 stop:2165 length:771 start_codon:yes stop_codon:yes gene_type:complete
MKHSFNKKKIIFFLNKEYYKFFFTSIFIVVFFVILYDQFYKKQTHLNIIIQFSEKFNYQLKFFNIYDLKNAKNAEIEKIIEKYIDQSIFLIPLKEISRQIKSVDWVREVNLSSDLQNTIEIKILEYQPVGLYNFNESLYFFSNDGKIITKSKNNSNIKKFIIFYGKNSIYHATYLISSLNKFSKLNMEKVKKAYYVGNRRWNILLENEILLLLSEKNIEDSLENYIEIKKNFNDKNLNFIKSIDLRNNNKAIVSFK